LDFHVIILHDAATIEKTPIREAQQLLPMMEKCVKKSTLALS